MAVPKPEMAPRSEPISPTNTELPVLATAPLLVKSTKLAAVPKTIVCPKFTFVNKNSIISMILYFMYLFI